MNSKYNRTVFFLTTILTFSISAYCQPEPVIYRQVIKDFAIKNDQTVRDSNKSVTLVVLKRPSYSIKVDDNAYFRLKEEYAKLNEQTFKDFVEKYRQNSQFKSIDISGIEIVVFEKDSLPRRQDLNSTYPNWNQAIIEISNIGFNEKKDQALIYYGTDFGSRSAGGIYIVYELKKRKWKQKKIIPAWST